MENKKLISFHGKPELKEFYESRILAHYHADEIVQGQYWINGKGCAVGCTIHSAHHKAFEFEIGIPQIIAKLLDKIFKGLPNSEAKELPLLFIRSVPVGVDLEHVWRKFFIWLLSDPDDGVIKYAKTDDQKFKIQNVIDLFIRSLSEEIKASDFRNAAAYAYGAYADAYGAYEDADAWDADAAAAAAYADAAAYAADAYAYAAYAAEAAAAACDIAAYAAAAACDIAAYAAYAAAAANDIAAYAAAAACDIAAYAAASRTNHYKKQRNKLIELLTLSGIKTIQTI